MSRKWLSGNGEPEMADRKWSTGNDYPLVWTLDKLAIINRKSEPIQTMANRVSWYSFEIADGGEVGVFESDDGLKSVAGKRLPDLNLFTGLLAYPGDEGVVWFPDRQHPHFFSRRQNFRLLLADDDALFCRRSERSYRFDVQNSSFSDVDDDSLARQLTKLPLEKADSYFFQKPGVNVIKLFFFVTAAET